MKHIVKLSGKIADHDTVGFSKWNREAEQKIKLSGIPYTILRGNFFMQNLFGSAAQIKQGTFTAGPAAKRIALLDTRDVAAAAVAALTEERHAGKTYDLNGPELLDGYAQAAVFSSVLGRPVNYLDVTADAFIGQLKSFGLPPWMVEAFGVAVADPEIPGDQSSAEIERILHRKPGTLEQFVKGTTEPRSRYPDDANSLQGRSEASPRASGAFHPHKGKACGWPPKPPPPRPAASRQLSD